MNIPDKISRKEFEKVDTKDFTESMIYDFLEKNKNTAFSFDFLKNKFKIKQSWLYDVLRNLRKSNKIEVRKKYYIFKKEVFRK